MSDHVQSAVPGGAGGDVFDRLLAANGDPGALRPILAPDGRSYVSLNAGIDPETGKTIKKNKLVANANATMVKESWNLLDTTIIEASRPKMTAFNMLRGTNTFTIPDGMAVTVLQHQTESDITDATVSMDGIRQGEADRVEYGIENLPLPIYHKDFHFSAREVAASARMGVPLDMRNAALAATKVAEKVEKVYLGVDPTFTYGGGTIYGLTNYPSRETKVLTNPTGTWTPEDTRTEVIEMIATLVGTHYSGPYDLLYGIGWLPYMQARYNQYDSTPLAEILRRVERVNSVTMSEFLPGFNLLLVERNQNVARAVVAMDIVVVQWDSHGGMQKNYKVMAIMVPQLRKDHDGNTGISHGNVT